MIKIFLVFISIVNLVSTVIHATNYNEKWFSRFALCVFCIAVYGIIDAIEKREND